MRGAVEYLTRSRLRQGARLRASSSSDPQPGAAPITLARYTHTLPDAMERAREQLDVFLVRPLRIRRTTARAEIQFPLCILIPVVMRDCGGFDAVSKTVVPGLEPVPERDQGVGPNAAIWNALAAPAPDESRAPGTPRRIDQRNPS